MDELLQEFIAETRETLAALAGEIVAWEANPADRARLDAIFRFVHTVKGSCGFLDLPRLAKLSHEAENVLAAVRDGRRSPDRQLVDAVLAIVDRIGELTEAIDAGVSVDDSDEALIAALDGPPIESEEGQVADSEPTAAADTVSIARTSQRSVRLPVSLLDRMMNGMSDMVLARNELARKLRDGRADPASEAALERLSLTVADLRDVVSRTRMQAIQALFAALPRMVRDTASQLGKQVNLIIEGGDVEIDREMVEAMRDPMMHIVRNAIDHGIEAPELRALRGKPEAGRMIVSARQAGNTIVIEISDDGAGIDVARLVAKHATANGRQPGDYAQLSDRARLELVFEPGLSSRDAVSEISGRGVGMDVVRANVEQIGGRIELANQPGRGLTIVVHVPLTLAILPTIVVAAGGQRFALARQSVEEIVAANCATVRIDEVGGRRIAAVRGERMPLIDLAGALDLPHAGSPAMLAIVGIPGGTYALAIDQVLDMEELVVKPASPPIMACGLFAGKTLPDNGIPMLVLDPAGIARDNGVAFSRAPALDAVAEEVVESGLEALLVRDLDGAVRAIPLLSVDRIEDVPIGGLGISGGRLRLTGGGEIVDIHARGPLPGEGSVTIVRLMTAGAPAGLAVLEAAEIVTLSGDWAAAEPGSGLLGIALHEDAAVEIIDPGQWQGGEKVAPEADDRPVCVLAGEARQWMAGFLAPALERAGYRVAIEPVEAGAAVAVLAMEDDEVAIPEGGALIRLADEPGGEGVFRFDRAAVIAALARAGR